MRLAASQPYFAPYPGFFFKACLADVLVILDEVQFPRGTTWLTRNRFKNSRGTLWMTVPVWKKGLGLQRINEVRICNEGRWAGKHLESLKTAYARAPFFPQHLGFIEEIFSGRFERLVDLNLAVIRRLLSLLGTDTRVVLLSELHIEATGSLRLVELCRRLGATCFIAQGAAKKYLNGNFFQESGIAFKFLHPPSPVYPQLWGEFIGNLSAFDLVFNCGPKAHEVLMRDRPKDHKEE